MPNFERYLALHNEIMNRLERCEITTEQAKEVNDLAFDKYIMERSLFKKDNNEKNYKDSNPKYGDLQIAAVAFHNQGRTVWITNYSNLPENPSLGKKVKKFEDELEAWCSDVIHACIPYNVADRKFDALVKQRDKLYDEVSAWCHRPDSERRQLRNHTE